MSRLERFAGVLTIGSNDLAAGEAHAFEQGYQAEILEAHRDGKLVDLRPRVLARAQATREVLARRSVPLRPGTRFPSPDGRFELRLRRGNFLWEVHGPDGVTATTIQGGNVHFLDNGETLVVDDAEAVKGIDLVSGWTLFSHPHSESTVRTRQAAAAREDAREARRKEDSGIWDADGELFRRRTFAGLRMPPGGSVRNVTLERCELSDCQAGAAPVPALVTEWERTVTEVENVMLRSCVLAQCRVEGLRLRRVIIESTPCTLAGCLFDRVVVRGHGTFQAVHAHISPEGGDPEWLAAAASRRRAKFYKRVEWALDLSGMESGYVTLGDIPLELVRFNQDMHFVMSRAQAATDAYKKVRGYRRTNIVDLIARFRRGSAPYLLLQADPGSEGYEQEVALFRGLRKAGLAT